MLLLLLPLLPAAAPASPQLAVPGELALAGAAAAHATQGWAPAEHPPLAALAAPAEAAAPAAAAAAAAGVCWPQHPPCLLLLQQRRSQAWPSWQGGPPPCSPELRGTGAAAPHPSPPAAAGSASCNSPRQVEQGWTVCSTRVACARRAPHAAGHNANPQLYAQSRQHTQAHLTDTAICSAGAAAAAAAAAALRLPAAAPRGARGLAGGLGLAAAAGLGLGGALPLGAAGAGLQASRCEGTEQRAWQQQQGVARLHIGMPDS